MLPAVLPAERLRLNPLPPGLRGIRLSNRILLAATILVTVVFVLPLLRLSFIDDEALNSYIDGWIRWHHATWWSFYTMVVALWLHGEGRIIPLNLGSVYLLNHLVHSAFAVKSLQIGFIGLNVFTFALVARRLTRSSLFGILAAACVALTLQIRFSLDPTAAFAPLLPLTAEFLFVAVLCQLEYQRIRYPLILIAGVGFFTAAALMYEITYAYIGIFIVVAWFRELGIRQRSLQIAAFALPLVILVGANMVLRKAAHLASNDPYALSSSAAAYLRTAWIQLVAGIPLTFAYFLPIRVYHSLPHVLADRPLVGYALGVAAAAVVVIVLARLRKDAVSIGTLSLSLSGGVGLLLWLLAVPMMAASPRWQTELVMGQGYLPTYFEYFGIALLLATAAAASAQWLKSRAAEVGIAVFIGVVTTLTYQTNRPSLAAYQPTWTQGRFAIEEAVRDGMFAGVPEGSTILLDDSYVWQYTVEEPNSNSRYLFFFLTGKRYAVQPLAGAMSALCPQAVSGKVCDMRGRDVVAYSSENASLIPGDRWTRVTPVDFIAPDANGAPQMYAVSQLIAARGAPLSRLSTIAAVDREYTKDASGGTVIASLRSCVARPLDALPNGSPLVFGAGFYGSEHNARENFRWSGRDSSLLLAAGMRSADVSVAFRLSTFVEHTRVAVSFDGKTFFAKPTPLGSAVTIKMRLSPFQKSVVHFRLIGKTYVSPSDSRELGFRLVNASVDARCHPSPLEEPPG